VAQAWLRKVGKGVRAQRLVVIIVLDDGRLGHFAVMACFEG